MKKDTIFLNRTGFTLAEVLITLGIIGVIASITIPPLALNYQKQQYVTTLKKAYAEFNQVLVKIAADKGCPGDLKCTGLFDVGTTHQSLGSEIVQYFNVLKDCGTPAVGCLSNKIADNFDGTSRTSWMMTNYGTSYKFITADNIAFIINNYHNNCGDTGSRSVTNNMTQICGELYVDVNGPDKGPNNFGRDIYNFYITNGKGPIIYPDGGADDDWDGHWQDDSGVPQYCHSGMTEGWQCAGRIIEEGWQMNY